MKKDLREAFKNFEDLLAQGNLVFLMGAGCSKCAGLPLAAELTERVLEDQALSDEAREMLTSVRDSFGGGDSAYVEDYLSELVDHLAIAERRAVRCSENDGVQLADRLYKATVVREVIEEVKNAIARILSEQVDVAHHRAFVSYLHEPRRPGRETTDQSVDYIVLNYDTAIEDALALERIRFTDGMEGGVSGWWSAPLLRHSTGRSRVLKIHGSIDWKSDPQSALPMRLNARVKFGEDESGQVLIWPASTKYRETQRDPYAQLFAFAREAMRPTPQTQKTLVVLGYSFGDAHVNLEIEQALQASQGDLTLVIFTSEDEPNTLVRGWLAEPRAAGQVLVFARRGYFHGDSEVRVEGEDSMDWWKFERLVELLEEGVRV